MKLKFMSSTACVFDEIQNLLPESSQEEYNTDGMLQGMWWLFMNNSILLLTNQEHLLLSFCCKH